MAKNSHISPVTRKCRRLSLAARLRQSEEGSQLAVRTDDGSWDWDLKTQEVYFSPRWKEMLGLDEGATGQIWLPRLHPNDIARLSAALEPLLDGTSDHFVCEHRMLHADGTYKWVTVRGHCLRDHSGKPIRMAGSQSEITGRVKALRALEQNEERLRALVEHGADSTFVHDMKGMITDVNPATCKALGYGRDELIGRPLTDIDQQFDPDRFRDAPPDLPSRAPIVHETALRRIDGSTFPVEVRSVVFAWNGEPHVLSTARDITERTRDEQALRTAKERLEFMVENADVGLWDWDLRTNESEYSASWRRRFGYGEDELRGSSEIWGTILHPDDRLAAATAVQQLLSGARQYEIELRLRHKDGVYRNVVSRGVAVRDASGRPIRVLGAHIDITERKALEEALRLSEEQYRRLVEEISDIIYAVNRDGRLTYMSPVVERLYGYTVAEMLQRHFSEFVCRDDVPVVVGVFREAVCGDPQSLDHRIVTKSGEIRWVRNSVRASWESDQIAGLRGVVSDITEQREAGDALRERTAQLEAANQELETFSYSVSHDLRAPLRHVEGFSRVLLEDYAERLDDDGRASVERIVGGCKRMAQLIEDLLALSRIGRQGLRHEPVDLSIVAYEIVAALREEQPERIVEVVIPVGLRATGDPGLLRTVLENLLGNAWKYTSKRPRALIEFGLSAGEREGGEAAETSLAPAGTRAVVTFFVRDNGAGFDQAQAQRLFAPFQRLHTTTEFEGTGIGLAIVQRIIHRHGGRVWAKAAVDQGAVFYFTLSA